MFDALSRLADGHARRVGLIAIAFFVLAGVLGGSVASHLAPYGNDDPATESVRANDLLESHGYRPTDVVVLVRGGRVGEPRFAARVKRIERRLEARRDVASVSGYYDTGSRAFVSRRGDATYLAVGLRGTDDGQIQDSAESIDKALASTPGVMVGGRGLAQEQINQQVERDLRTAELIAFPLLFLLSLLFFRSLVAALLPLMVGALAIVGTFLALRIASELGSISIFALNLTTGLGLGLAIDYSLFIVSRYREEIAKDGPGLAAMRRTMARAGRTVLFSSLTVAAAIASLTVFPQRFLYSMGIGGACVALIAAAVSLTVLPAVLTLLGTRVNSLSPRLPAAPGGARDERRHRRVLVPAVPLRDAPAGSDCDDHSRRADRARAPLPRDQVQLGRLEGAAPLGQRPPGRRGPAQRLPALPHDPDRGRRRGRPGGGRAGSRTAWRSCRGSARSTRHSGWEPGLAAIEAIGDSSRVSDRAHATAEQDPRAPTACRQPDPGDRGRRRVRRPPVEPQATISPWRWRSWSPPPSWSSS